MARFNSNARCITWLNSINVNPRIQNILFARGYDNVSLIRFITNDEIDSFDELNTRDKNSLKTALNGSANHGARENSAARNIAERGQNVYRQGARENSAARNIEERDQNFYEQVRWREFGMSRFNNGWKQYFYPVEVFSPDGCWAWNAAAKSQMFVNKKNVSEVWNGFDNNRPGWLLAPPVLLPSSLKSFKLTFSFRVKPNDEEDYPMLQILLVNDAYNKRLFGDDSEQVSFHLTITFLNIIDGMPVGVSLEEDISFDELHGSVPIQVPGRILHLKKPPIVLLRVTE